MAISGDLRVSATIGPYAASQFRSSLHPSKVDLSITKIMPTSYNTIRCHSNKRPLLGTTGGEFKLSPFSISQEAESFLLNAINMSFLERLSLAWKIIFPSSSSKRKSNANIAKQRLKMILFSDRCAVSDEAKQKIVSNVVSALSDFVEIESQDKVQLSVSTDADLGTIYSVTVPVRRVRSEYQEENESGTITNIEYKNNEDDSGAVDVKFDFYVPNDKFNDFV